MFINTKNLRVVGTAVCSAFFVSSASAAVYTLNESLGHSNHGSDSDLILFSSPANWLVDGVVPSTGPQSGDTITWPGVSTWGGTTYFELDGDYEVASLVDNYKCFHLYKSLSAVSSTVSLTFNTQLGGSGYQYYWLHDGTKLVLPVGSSFLCSLGDHGPTTMHIGTNAEADIYGAVQSRVLYFNVASGGKLVFAPSAYVATSKNNSSDNTLHDHDEFNIAGGSVYFPNGINMTGSSSSSVAETINLSGGTVEFGGNFLSTVPWAFSWSGGTISATADVEFGATVAVSVPASASVAVDVAAGATFVAKSLSADSTATIAKTGAGVFAISPATAAAISLEAGSLALSSAGTYDLSNVTIGSGVTPSIKLLAMGARIDTLPSDFSTATFVADFTDVAAGTVVFYSADSELLEQVKVDLAPFVPSGMTLATSGDALSLEVQSSYAFTASGNLLDAGNWGGSLPPAGVDVSIEGAGVIATLSSGALPAWNSIEVKNGATLRISTDATLVPVILNKSATLEIANNATATLASVGDLSGFATANQIPVVSVASGSTLNVPGGMKFKNVNISLAGTIAATTVGGIVFGYAEVGETSYIGLSSNGGTISIEPGSGDYNSSNLQFCCPAAGGTVNAVGSLVLASTTFLPNYVRGDAFPLTTAYQIGFYVGVNNPASIPFEVLFDNSQWGVMGGFYVKGGATFRLINGGAYKNFESVGYWGRYAQIAENGRIVVGSGGEFRMNALGDYGTNPLEVIPSSSGHQSIIVEAGGIFETYRSSGNGNGVFSVSNGVYTIYQPSIYNEHYSQSSGSTTIYDTTNIPFAGFQSVALGDDSTLTFSTRNKVFWDAGQFGNEDGDRVVQLADVPITGSNASIALDNANVNVFGVIVRSGSNTATGTASVVEPAAGEGETTLYFADGANWAGTVISDNVALTNLVDATQGVSVTFNNLRLPSGNLVLRQNDTLTIDGAVLRQGGDTGRLIVEEGYGSLRAKSADAFANANIRNAQGRRLVLKPSATADANGYYTYTAAVPTGITVIIR